MRSNSVQDEEIIIIAGYFALHDNPMRLFKFYQNILDFSSLNGSQPLANSFLVVTKLLQDIEIAQAYNLSTCFCSFYFTFLARGNKQNHCLLTNVNTQLELENHCNFKAQFFNLCDSKRVSEKML